MSHTHDHQGNMDMPQHDMPMVMNMVMQMNFYWGKDVTILFKGWPDNHLGMYILSLLFVFFMAFGVEIMSMGPRMIIKRSIAGVIQAGIYYTVRMVLVYFVMLAVMSFNIGIFIVAILGHGLGFVVVKLSELSMAETTTGSNATDPKV
ncbi:unnamed protein product [Withania somnifera]